MKPEINVIGWGMLACLHCGKVFDMNKEIHLCNAPKNEWLNKQRKAYIQMPDGRLWDLKNKND